MPKPSLLPPKVPGSALYQTSRFLWNPFTLINEAVQDLGDVFLVRILGLGDWVFLCSPELVREMFKASPEVLAAGEVNASGLGFMLGRDASFSLDGRAHLDRRRLVHPLLNGRTVHTHIDSMREITEKALRALPIDRPFAFLSFAHRISLSILAQTMFRAAGSQRAEELADLFEKFASKGLRSPLIAIRALQVNLGSWSPWGKVLGLRQAVKVTFTREIEARLARAEERATKDLLDELIQAKQQDGKSLSKTALLDETINLLFAGHETTGNILAWTLECLLSHPEVMRRVKEELKEVLDRHPIQSSHISKLEYLDAVISEAIRYRPIAPMAGIRKVKRPFPVGDYLIPEGMTVVQCFPAMACRPEIFARPKTFDPEHFYRRKMRAYEWNPFGGGTRMCIGRGLAELELKVVLATVLQQSELQLAQSQVKPVRQGMFFSPSKGLQIVLKRRSPIGE